MEAVEESEPNVLREIASEEELAQIPRELTRKINAHFNAKFEEFITAAVITKAVFETSRKWLEQNLETAQKELAEQKLDLDECRGKLEVAEKSNTEVCSNLEEVKIEVHGLQESVKRLEKETCELRRQRDTVTDEANALQLQVERRDTEIERMFTELSSSSSQFQTAIATKCQTLIQKYSPRILLKSHSNCVNNMEHEKTEVHGLQESVNRLEKENCELRRQRDTVTDEANALQLQVERRDTEIERMLTELSSLSSQFQTAIATKCQTLVQKYSPRILLKSHSNCVNSMELSSDESKELSRCSLSALPNEILLEILKNLDLKTLYLMSKVDKRFKNLTQDPKLYTHLDLTYKSKKYMCRAFSYFTPRCKYLQQLDLTCSKFRVNGLVNFLNNCGRHLTHLCLSACCIEDMPKVGLKPVLLSREISRACKNLKELDLNDCYSDYDENFSYFELHNLESINFSGLPISTKHICKILQDNPRIREINLGYWLSDEILVEFAKCRNLEVLHTLYLEQDEDVITSKGINALANCKNLQKVSFHLYNYPIADDSFFRLFSSYQNLQEISLYFPPLTNHRLELLAQCKNLKSFVLQHGCTSLYPCNNYSVILKQCPKLQEFTLLQCDISEELVKQWKERYPHVSINIRNY